MEKYLTHAEHSVTLTIKMTVGEAIAAGSVFIWGVVLLSVLFCWKSEKSMEKEPKFEIFLDEKKEFRFRLKAPNGEIICQSEGYKSKQGCKDTMAVLASYAAKAKIIDLT